MKCENGPLVNGGALKLACDTTGFGHPEEISVTLTGPGPSGQTIDIILDNTIAGNETYTNLKQFGKISLIFDDISSTVVGGNFVGGSFAPSVPFVGALFGTVVVGDWILTIADNSQDFPLGYANFSLTITGDDAAAVPEPATTGLVALGLWALAALRRKPVRFRS